MFRIAAAAAAAAFFSTSAIAATVDTFALDVTSAAGTDSTVILETGKRYTVTVSGTMSLGSNATRHIADAEYFNLGSSPLAPLDFAGSQEIGVGIDGADVNFGGFNVSNVYTTTVFGDGTTLNVFFQDSNYADNSGSLDVEISLVPLPAGMALLVTGLAGFAAVGRRRSSRA
ncbi:MAG: VPLPA-CTERM sorting domain-containing protein [Pseudomonadota bacterium]